MVCSRALRGSVGGSSFNDHGWQLCALPCIAMTLNSRLRRFFYVMVGVPFHGVFAVI